MSSVIDFEGFQLPSGRFVVKELAFYAVKANHMWGVWNFQPPSPFEELPLLQRNQFSWVTRNIHLMDWREGSLPYSKLQSIISLLFEVFPIIYVKGIQKQHFLEVLTSRKCYNLEDFNCPKIEHLIPIHATCSVHAPDFKHCALVKATAYGKFCNVSLNRTANLDYCHSM